MKEKVLVLGKKILKQELVTGSIYIFVGSIIANIFNLFFNLFMSRNLLPQDYGVLISVISLSTLIGIPVGAITPMIINFAGARIAKGDYGSVKAFFLKIIKPLLVVSFVIFFCSIVFARYIGSFFQIVDQTIIIIAGITVALAYVGVVSNGLLQAKLAFKFISFINVLSMTAKLFIGVLLVFMGFRVVGAMLAFFISGLIPLALGFIYLKSIFLSKTANLHRLSFKNISSYGIPSSLAVLGMTSLISTDILLVKHFFDPLQAGIYSGLSLVGKVIFFFTAPIGSVMFPLIIRKHAKNESYNDIFKMAIVMVFVPSAVIAVFYFLYPSFAISFFIKNEAYLAASHLLGLFGLFIVIYSLISLFVYYFLSIKKTNVYIPVIFAAIGQVFLIVFFHAALFAVVVISFIVALILLAVLMLYFVKVYSEYKKTN